MTDFAVYSLPSLPEDLSWDITPDIDGSYAESGTLDIALFTAAQHYPNGYLKSGAVLGLVTATGKLGPYLSTATDGRQTAVGILKGSLQVIQPLTGQAKANVGCAVYKAWAVVSLARLPYTSTAMSTSRTVTDGSTTAASTTVTSATAAFTSADVGSTITGGSIPANTTITSVTNATTVVVSAAPTATATGVSLTITHSAGGYIDAAAQTALSHIHFAA